MFTTQERNFQWPAGPEWRLPFDGNTVIVNVTSYNRPIDPQKGLIKVAVFDLKTSSLCKFYEVPFAEYGVKLAEIDIWLKTLPNPLTQEWLILQGFKWD